MADDLPAEEARSQPTPAPQQRLVAVCDILGFKNLVYDNPLGQVGVAMTHLRRMLGYAILQSDPGPSPPTLAALRAQASVNIAVFSDTIFMWAKGDTKDEMLKLVESVGWLLFGTAMTANIMGVVGLRGGLAYGEVLIEPDNDLFIGKPIIEAYKMEGAQNWSGATLCPSAVNRLAAVGLDPSTTPWLREYPVPLKMKPVGTVARVYRWLKQRALGGKTNDVVAQTVVDWTFGVHMPDVIPWPEEPSSDQDSRLQDAVEKIRNTKAFHTRVCRWC